MTQIAHPLARRITEATSTVFGDSTISMQVAQVCARFETDLKNIQSGRGISALLIAVVGAKGQGKTWIARQLIRSSEIREQLRSGDLVKDATTHLVWIGPVPPDSLDPNNESYLHCPVGQMVELGQPFVLLDTPGITDSDQRASQLSKESLSLAPIKLLAIARDQIRAASNLNLAGQIDGAICIPVITSVEPQERESAELADDLRSLRDQLNLLAPHSRMLTEILVPDFEITGDEVAAGEILRAALLDQLSELGVTQTLLAGTSEIRIRSAMERLRSEVRGLISNELPQLAEAVARLNRETQQLPARVLASLLGGESILETGLRMRLRARLAGDTSLLWFPYRTVLSLLTWTHGAWDRIVLALTGSVPSVFGALTAWARNVRQGREFSLEVSDGIRQRSQQQVEERLLPLCDQFHRAVMKLRSREERMQHVTKTVADMRLLGMDELQTRSQAIFEDAIERYATPRWRVQLAALLGTVLFWSLMAAPIVVLYRDYLSVTFSLWSGKETTLENFPSPHPGLLVTSLLLSLLPLMIYCMVVLTVALSRGRMQRIAREVANEHEQVIEQLQRSEIIRIRFDDEVLEQAEFLLSLE
jgi:hypothetical protein